ncbi:MAG: adenylyltransferase/cytidyltransferase family protein [Caulobacteraceae bacterium]|nr:adenylyltransferase/cytidyltransferase family protein [Caulobacteraceae bacterium]
MRKAERTKALYAGSFDPITRGHLDIVGKALMTFDAVHVAIGANVRKQRAFSVEESLRLIMRCTSSEVLRQVGFGFSGELASSGVDI